jgi:hypothetical protein
MKNAVFWNVGPCRSAVNRRFGGTCSRHLQGRKLRERGTSVSQSAATCSRWFLFRGFFYPEDGGDTFLRSVGSHKIYTVQHPRRWILHYHIYRCFPLEPIMGYINQVHILSPYLSKIHFNIISSSIPISSKRILPFNFPDHCLIPVGSENLFA